MMFILNQTVTAFDLAKCLRGEHGTFVAQNGGNLYSVIATEGHSIASLTPIGKPIPYVSQEGGLIAPPWIVTKVSSGTDGANDAPLLANGAVVKHPARASLTRRSS